MATGNKKSDKWALVINGKKEAQESDLIADFKDLQQLLLHYKGFYFVCTIIHDKDRLADNTPKRTHLHCYFESETNTHASMLADLTEILGIEKERISLSPTNSQILQPQYLTHKNDPSKTQYKIEQVLTTNQEEYRKRWGSEYQAPIDKEQANQQTLINSKTITELMQTCGIEFANKNRGLFKQIKEEQELDYNGLCRRLVSEQERYARLFDAVVRFIDDIRLTKDIETILKIAEMLEDYARRN